MAEPARKLEDIEPDIQPRFGVIPGGGKSTPERAPLKAIEESEESATEGSWLDNVKKEREELEAQQKRRQRRGKAYIKLGKRKGPMIAIILTVVGGGIGISALLSPSLLIIHMKETLAGILDSAGPAQSIRTNKVLYKKFKSAKFAFEQSSEGNCNIRCKFGSMSDTMKRNFEAKGFKIDATEGKGLAKGRWIIQSMEFPDGHVVKNGAEFAEATKDAARASNFKEVFNSKVVYFLNSKFGVILREKFGLNKLANFTQSLKDEATNKLTSTKEKINEAIRKTLKLPAVDPNANPKLTTEERVAAARANPKYTKVFAFIDGPLAKTSNVTGIIQGICASYNVIKGVTYATKAAKVASIVGFAMIFLNAGDQIKAGDMDAATADALGTMLTEPDANGKAATDSTGFKMAAFGDTGTTLSDEAQKTSIAPSGTILASLTALAKLAAVGGTVSLLAMHSLCKGAGNWVVAIAQSCPEQIVVAATTGIETVGIGAAISAISCVGQMLVTMAAVNGAIGVAVGAVTKAIIGGEIPTLDGNSRGEMAGDAIYSGSSQIMGGTAAAYGLKAGSTAEIKQYAIDTAIMKKQQDTIASYEARNTPLDIYNQYSFLGSIAKTLNVGALYNSSILSSIGNVLSIIPKSLATITSNIGADVDKKAQIYAKGQCNDSSLLSLGIDADAFCNPSYVMSSTELDNDIDTVTDYMINGISGGFIDKNTGAAIPGSDYQKYLDNCANRIAPLGDSSGPIEDDDYEWVMGSKCVENSTMLSNFRTYTMDKAINDTMDEL